MRIKCPKALISKHLCDDKASVLNLKKTDIEACNGPLLKAGCEANSAEAEKRAFFSPGEKKGFGRDSG